MPQSLSAVYIHLIFSTKERFPFLKDLKTRQAAFAYLSGTSKKLDCPTIAVGAMPDHVHILARFGRTISQADWVKELKRVTNGWLKKQRPQFSKFEWQSGYAAFSVSQSNLNRVRKYINEQETHHRRFGFQNELRTLLRKHEIDFDSVPHVLFIATPLGLNHWAFETQGCRPAATLGCITQPPWG